MLIDSLTQKPHLRGTICFQHTLYPSFTQVFPFLWQLPVASQTNMHVIADLGCLVARWQCSYICGNKVMWSITDYSSCEEGPASCGWCSVAPYLRYKIRHSQALQLDIQNTPCWIYGTRDTELGAASVEKYTAMIGQWGGETSAVAKSRIAQAHLHSLAEQPTSSGGTDSLKVVLRYAMPMEAND